MKKMSLGLNSVLEYREKRKLYIRLDKKSDRSEKKPSPF